MPPLAQSVMIDAAKTRFRMFDLSRTIATPGRALRAPGDKADLASQTEVTKEVSAFVDGICEAIVNAHNTWRQQAFLKGVQINAMSAFGGGVTGPSLVPLIMSRPPRSPLFGAAHAVTQAVAAGLDACWREWQNSVRVPGLPWWPSFVAVPGRETAPIPNVPTPLSALTWNNQAISTDALVRAMQSRLTMPLAFSTELFTAIATGFRAALDLWFPAQMISNVLGRGAVPTFAPPYVPVGPVVSGSIIEAPPHFMP